MGPGSFHPHRNRQARELAAWGASLRAQQQRLAGELARVLGRVAQTEELVALAFAHRALTAHHRTDELRCYVRQAHAVAARLRSKQQQLRTAIAPPASTSGRDRQTTELPDSQNG
jgi:hypothetical protein